MRITTGLNPHGITVSQNGTRLAYSAFTETSNVWSLPVPATGAVSVSTAVPATQGNQMIENLGVSHDGKWLGYNTDRGGTTQVYLTRLDAKSTEPQQLTSDTSSSYWVAFSPNGKEIAFHRFRGERRQIFVTPVEGGVAVPVTDGREDVRSPEWSPDGRQLLLLASWGTTPKLLIVKRASDGHWSKPRVLPINAMASATTVRHLICSCIAQRIVADRPRARIEQALLPSAPPSRQPFRPVS